MGTLCFDLDGTLCANTFGDYASARPFPWAVKRVAELAAAGHRIVILTARGSATGIDWGDVTRAQLEEWGVVYDELRFGKPSADVYVDDRAVNAEAWLSGDAWSPPGFGRRSLDGRTLPAVLPPAVTSVVEVGRTFAGVPLRLEAHASRAWALAVAAGVQAPASRESVIAATREALAGASAGEELVYAICLDAGGHMAFSDGWTESENDVHVSCRPLHQTVASLESPLVRSGERGSAIHAALASPADGRWPLAEERGRVVDRRGGYLGVVRRERLALAAPAGAVPPVAWEWLRSIAARCGRTPHIEVITTRDLEAADEAFIVGYPHCLVGLASIDGRELGPGRVTAQLLEAWSEEAGVDLAGQLLSADEPPAIARAAA